MLLLLLGAAAAQIAQVYCFQDGALTTHLDPSEAPAIDLVVANGGAGQAGMIEFLSFEYLKSSTQNLCIGWHASNTYGSHDALKSGVADVAIVYDISNIHHAILNREALDSTVHVWMDRFIFMGPISNPASITPGLHIQDFFLKLMKTPDAYWVTRVDHSTTHRKEAFVVVRIVSQLRQEFNMDFVDEGRLLNLLTYQGSVSSNGHVRHAPEIPLDVVDAEQLWSIDRMHENYTAFQEVCRIGFYKPMHLLPIQTARTVNVLQYYTMSDFGIYSSLHPAEKSNLQVFLGGKDTEQAAFFLNPAYALQGTQARNPLLAASFMAFLKNPNTQMKLVPSYKGRIESNSRPMFEAPYPSYKRFGKESLESFVRRIPSIYNGVFSSESFESSPSIFDDAGTEDAGSQDETMTTTEEMSIVYDSMTIKDDPMPATDESMESPEMDSWDGVNVQKKLNDVPR